ncbi:MAG: hypothetical protein HC831_07765 [Chloroflexia bacterium]|nr:hypothetical protein [Chloroflexia bacterium]
MWTGNKIYYFSLKDHLDRTVTLDIYKKGYSGDASTLQLYEIEIEQTNKDPFYPIKSKGCDIAIKEPSRLQYADFFNTPRNTYKTVVKVDGSIAMEGFISPDLYSGSLSMHNRKVYLPVTDGLGYLDEYFPVYEGTVKLIDVIYDILNSTNLDYTNIYINSNLFEVTQEHFGKTLFTQTWLDNEAFEKTDGDPMNGKEILENILKTFNVFVYQRGGAWYIDRWTDFYNPNSTTVRYIKYTNSGGIVSSQQHFITRPIINIGETFQIIDEGDSLQRTSGVGKFILERPLRKYDNFITSNANSATAQPAGDGLEPPLNKWFYNDSGTISYNEPNNEVTFDSSTSLYAVHDGFATKIRFTYNPENENDIAEEADHLIISSVVTGDYGTTLEYGKMYVSIGLRIVNDTNDFYYVYAVSENKFVTSPNIIGSTWSNEIVFEKKDGVLVDWEGKKVTWDFNLYNCKHLLEEHNTAYILFEQVRAVRYYNGYDDPDEVIHPRSKWQDINVNVASSISDVNNVIEGIVNSDFTSVLEETIPFGDIPNYNYYNGFFSGTTGNEKSNLWTDLYDSSICIEEKFILDRIQLYNKPRYEVSLQCRNTYPTTNYELYTIDLIDPSHYYVTTGYRHNLVHAIRC